MSKPTGSYNPGSALAVDTDPPNTTAPDEKRVFVTTSSNDAAVYCLALGGAVTVQLWGYLAGRWFKIGAAQACPVDTMTYLPAIPPMDVGNLYLQVTVNTTAACTGIHWGFQGKR